MAFDGHKNLSYSTVAGTTSNNGLNPGSGGTSLTVATGDGSKFPATPFNALVWPAGSTATQANAEIVRVTGITSDTLTITRTQESSTNRSIVVGDQIAATITAKVITDIETNVWGVTLGGTGATALTAHGVVVGNGTSAVNVTGTGTSGQLLTSNGVSADPTFQDLNASSLAGGAVVAYLARQYFK